MVAGGTRILSEYLYKKMYQKISGLQVNSSRSTAHGLVEQIPQRLGSCRQSFHE